MQRALLWLIVFVSGFCGLALEVLCPRILSSVYGSTMVGWAFSIAVVLGGLSFGYLAAGFVPAPRAKAWLMTSLLIAALMTAGCRAICLGVADLVGRFDWSSILIVTMAALILPSVCFGAIPVLCLELLLPGARISPSALSGRIFALSTVGSIGGALAGVFIGVQHLGIRWSLAFLAFVLILLTAPLARLNSAVAAIAATSLLLLDPNSGTRPGMNLIETTDSAYSTVQVLEQGQWKVLAIGPQLETLWNGRLRLGAPYVMTLRDIALSRRGTSAFIIGGAGNALAHVLEDAGYTTTVIELDSCVADMGVRHFGPIRGRIIIGDGRCELSRHPNPVDAIVIDAFSGPSVIPSHLLTVEFFQLCKIRLSEEGIVAINVHGACDGELSSGVHSICNTLSEVFSVVQLVVNRDMPQEATAWQNVWICGALGGSLPGVPCHLTGARPSTDDLNPTEGILERMRQAAFADASFRSVWR